MGKSTASCFKFIACGGDSVDHDDLQTAECKDLSDQRGWSFRKRSARHRVLSNIVTSETSSSANHESTDTSVINFSVQPELNLPEKTLLGNATEEKAKLSPQPDSKISEDITAAKKDESGDLTYDESSIIKIQAAIRGFLARQVLLKEKNIIKLQAAVRGHIVRRYALGTLHCIQAIIKMQALVRAHHVRRIVKGSSDFVKHEQNSGKDRNDSVHMGMEKAKPNGIYTYVSIERLLSNAFGCQLMESTPRPNNIKCEPSKSDAAWKWLERWTEVASVTIVKPMESGSAAELHKENIEQPADGKRSISVPSNCYTDPKGSGFGVVVSTEAFKNNVNLIHYDANSSDPHSFTSLSPSSSHPKVHPIDHSNVSFGATESDHIEIKETDFNEEIDKKSLSKEEEINERDGPNSRKLSNQKPETEVKEIVRKASNPAFLAAESKFEELSSVVAPVKLLAPSINDPRVESSLDSVSSATEQPLNSKDDVLADNTFPNASPLQNGGSACGTLLSVPSTLNSPEKSEAGVNNIEHEEVSVNTSHCINTESLDLKTDGKSMMLESDQSCTNAIKLEKEKHISSAPGEYLNSITAESSHPEMKLEADSYGLQQLLGHEVSQPVNGSSPEASPISQLSVPESQATPSSQVSVKPKKNKGEKSRLIYNNKSSSADKNPPANHIKDAASKSSLDNLDEHKNGKERQSLGSEKPNHREHEPRDNSSSKSLPGYMQVTESARAKSIANSSPRSSPDVVHDKDVYIIKRHSLPSSNETERSPRIRPSVTHAKQNVKGNWTHSPQERKWRR